MSYGDTKSAVAWLYKTGVSKYYVQFNRRADLAPYKGIPKAAELFKQPPNGGNYPIVRLNASEVLSVESALGAREVFRVRCFKSDYQIRR